MPPADTLQRRGPDSVLLGRDDYLFERLYGVQEHATGVANLSPALVQRWVSLIETRVAWCRQRGARYVLFIVPEKHVVYADKLPHNLTVPPDRAVARLLAALTPEIRDSVIYPAADLIAGRETEPTYFQADSHWTEHGSWLAYCRLRQALWPDEPLPDAVFEKTAYRRVGDLGVRLHSPRFDMATNLVPIVDNPHRRVRLNFAFNVGQVEILEREIQQDRRCVMFRDSAGSSLLPFLANDFNRLVAVASGGMLYDLLRSERPNVVITQMTEHALCTPSPADPKQFPFPDDLPPHDFQGLTGLALPLVRHATRETDNRTIADLDYSGQHDPVWSDGPCTEIVLRCRVPHTPCELELTVSGFVHPPTLSAQHVDIVVNSHLVGSFEIGAGIATVRCAIPLECLFSGRTLRVELYHPNCVVPASIGAGDELREIAIRLHRLVFHSAG